MRLTEKYGSWALVTGASSGIGRALAVELASQGFNLLVTARRKHLLLELEGEIKQTYRRQVVWVPGDLCVADTLNLLMEKAVELKPGIAVLSAGFGSSGPFLQSRLQVELAQLDLNCRVVMEMTHKLGQLMQAEGRGALVYLSSIVALQGVPMAAQYAAGKAYVQHFAEGLGMEFRQSGIDVLSVAPGPVHSGFAERAHMHMDKALKPQEIAPEIISAIGRKNHVIPGGLSKILSLGLLMVPRPIKIRIMQGVMSKMALGTS